MDYNHDRTLMKPNDFDLAARNRIKIENKNNGKDGSVVADQSIVQELAFIFAFRSVMKV